MNLRPFNQNDLQKFSNVKILSYQKKEDAPIKEYLFIERQPFISCFICINNTLGVFVEQYRPVINKTTLEIPMGKIEDFEKTAKEALIRELQEECNIFISENNPYILLKNKCSQEIVQINFEEHQLKEDSAIFVSPGFSNSKQHPFTLLLKTNNLDILNNINDFTAFSNEENLQVYLKPITHSLIQELDGLSQFHLMKHLYLQTLFDTNTPLSTHNS